MIDKQETRLREIAPRDELALMLREATVSVEADLALEDEGWINLSGTTGDVITSSERITNLKLSRLYATKDPMGKQAIRLWTDYTFGSGMAWDTEDKGAKKALEGFWDAPTNQSTLSARGQRMSSDKLLIDGEVFFAIFLGSEGAAKIRLIDPLEITDIITDPDDRDDVRYYRRQWVDTLGMLHSDFYRSTTNINNEGTQSALGDTVKSTQDALVYHLTRDTTTQRGNPLLLPCLLWMKYLTLQLASYIAVDLAGSKFVLRSKVKGGQAAVDAIKAKTHDQEVGAGSHLFENLGVDTGPFTIDKRAKNAYDGARLTKLQISAATGIPEQYFGDLATGNLATAKTVELPMMKMFQSYQKVWEDTYQDINGIVLAHNQVPPDKWYVDMDFPRIAPLDVQQAAEAVVKILTVMPELSQAPDVQQVALMTLGINDPAEVIDALSKETGENKEALLIKTLKQFRESLKEK